MSRVNDMIEDAFDCMGDFWDGWCRRCGTRQWSATGPGPDLCINANCNGRVKWYRRKRRAAR